MTRSPSDYLNDDWSMTPPDANNASGAGETPDGPAPSVPYTQRAPLTPDWGMLGSDRGGYGHSDDVVEVPAYKTWDDVTKDDVAQGYTKPGSGGAKEPGTASFEQSIPDKNEWDRGAGSDSYAREHSATTGRGFDGRGNDKGPGPGETIGSSKIVG